MTETAHHPMLADDRVARWLGVTLEAAEKDHARIRMTLTEDQHNGFGLAHDALGERIFHLQELVLFALQHFVDRHADRKSVV